jgi:hypothetical protein
MEVTAIGKAVTTDLAQLTRTPVTKTGQPAPAAPKAGQGAPPGGGGGGAQPAAASGSSSTARIYDKRDANQDGIVSAQEALLYALTHPQAETQTQATVSASQMQAGLNAYQQNQLAEASQ